MTETNMRQALNIVRRQQYRVWFDRWFAHTNVAEHCRQSAERGFTSLVIYRRANINAVADGTIPRSCAELPAFAAVSF